MEKSYRAELVGVFGDPIDENPTVVLEEAAFAATGLHYRYLNLHVRAEHLAPAIAGAKAMGFRGFNCTIPHKCAVLPFLDEISPSASIIGAVNTVVIRPDGSLFGENTDGKGFLASLTDTGIAASGSRVVILGAGGAARAIAVELALAGATQITIVNRDRSRGETLVSLLQEKTPAQAHFVCWDQPYIVAPETTILINATSIGLYPDASRPDILYNTVLPGMTVCDVIPNPPRTAFLKEVEKRGANTIDGLGMLVNQGAVNFTLWTGVPAPVQVMSKAIHTEFGV